MSPRPGWPTTEKIVRVTRKCLGVVARPWKKEAWRRAPAPPGLDDPTGLIVLFASSHALARIFHVIGTWNMVIPATIARYVNKLDLSFVAAGTSMGIYIWERRHSRIKRVEGARDWLISALVLSVATHDLLDPIQIYWFLRRDKRSKKPAANGKGGFSDLEAEETSLGSFLVILFIFVCRFYFPIDGYHLRRYENSKCFATCRSVWKYIF